VESRTGEGNGLAGWLESRPHAQAAATPRGPSSTSSEGRKKKTFSKGVKHRRPFGVEGERGSAEWREKVAIDKSRTKTRGTQKKLGLEARTTLKGVNWRGERGSLGSKEPKKQKKRKTRKITAWEKARKSNQREHK